MSRTVFASYESILWDLMWLRVQTVFDWKKETIERTNFFVFFFVLKRRSQREDGIAIRNQGHEIVVRIWCVSSILKTAATDSRIYVMLNQTWWFSNFTRLVWFRLLIWHMLLRIAYSICVLFLFYFTFFFW